MDKKDSIKLKRYWTEKRIYPLILLSSKKLTYYFHTRTYTQYSHLPVKELLPEREDFRQTYAMPQFRLNNTRIYHNTPLRNKYFLNIQRFSISATTAYDRRARTLLQQKTDFKFNITQKSATMFTQDTAVAAVSPPYCREQ